MTDQDLKKNTLRTLISVSDNVDEADGYVVNFDPARFSAPESVNEKYDFVLELFGIGGMFATGNDVNDVEVNYKALLSTLIIQRWG